MKIKNMKMIRRTALIVIRNCRWLGSVHFDHSRLAPYLTV